MAAAVNPPLFLFRPRFHYDNKSYELALPRRYSLAYDDYAYSFSPLASHARPAPAHVNLSPAPNVVRPDPALPRRRNSFESAVRGDSLPRPVTTASASSTLRAPAAVILSENPRRELHLNEDLEETTMPRGTGRRPMSAEMKAQRRQLQTPPPPPQAGASSLNANDIFFIAGGIERLDTAEAMIPDVGRTGAGDGGGGGVEAGAGGGGGEEKMRPDSSSQLQNENPASLRPRGEAWRSMTSVAQLNQSSSQLQPNMNTELNDQVSPQDRRSSANLSQVPIYGANHAPLVIAFPAAATTATAATAPPFHETTSQSGSEAEARRRERDILYAEVDAENSSMGGRILSPSTDEDLHQENDCAGCVSTTNTCFDCLKRIPCASTFALAMMLAGLGCLSASLLIAARQTRQIFASVGLQLANRTVNVFGESAVGVSSSLVPLDFFETLVLGVCPGMFFLAFLLLLVAFFSSGITRRIYFLRKQSQNICGRLLNGSMFALAYLLTLGWIGASGLLSIPLYLLYVFQDNCSDSFSTTSSPNICLNLRHYGILSGEDFKVCETNLTRLCKDVVTLYPAYICAYLGSVIVICSLIHFLVCITANYAHIKKDRLPIATEGGGGGEDGSLHGGLLEGRPSSWAPVTLHGVNSIDHSVINGRTPQNFYI